MEDVARQKKIPQIPRAPDLTSGFKKEFYPDTLTV